MVIYNFISFIGCHSHSPLNLRKQIQYHLHNFSSWYLRGLIIVHLNKRYKMQAHSSNPIVAIKKIILIERRYNFYSYDNYKIKIYAYSKDLFSGLIQWYNWWKEILFKTENGNLCYNKLLFIIIRTLEESWGRARLSTVSLKKNKALTVDCRKELCSNEVNATQFSGFPSSGFTRQDPPLT